MQPFKYRSRINSGLFRHYINIQQMSSGTNENGFPEEKWTDFKDAWAMLKTPNDKSSNVEFYSAASTYAKNTMTFVIRYTEGIDSDMRIKYKGRFYEIAAPPINDNGLDETLTIIGREVS